MSGKYAALVLIAVLLVSGCTTQQAQTQQTDDNQVVIGLSLATLRIERWQTDSDLLTERAEQLGASVITLSADDDADVQNRQAENLILQGVDVLIVVPQDAEKSAVIIEKAHEAGIKVIAYDRLIKNSDLDYYITFDNVKVGEEQARGVLDVVSNGSFAYIGGSPTDNNAFLVRNGSFKLLQPRIDSGDITLVLDEFTQDWRPEIAYENMKNYLQSGGKVDAVVAANDGTAGGVIQALTEAGLAGKVPVSGQDAALDATQRIVEGTQTVTVYKPIKNIAYKAAEAAVALAKGEVPDTNAATDNGKVDVPSYLLDVVAVTKGNIVDTVIKDGFQTYENVYKNIPEDQRPPR